MYVLVNLGAKADLSKHQPMKYGPLPNQKPEGMGFRLSFERPVSEFRKARGREFQKVGAAMAKELSLASENINVWPKITSCFAEQNLNVFKYPSRIYCRRQYISLQTQQQLQKLSMVRPSTLCDPCVTPVWPPCDLCVTLLPHSSSLGPPTGNIEALCVRLAPLPAVG